MINERPVILAIDGKTLEGNLTIPKKAGGIVIFAHGSGSSRKSPRNRYVASILQEAGLATLLFDLLTGVEEKIDSMTGELRFDIDLLARRLAGALDWTARNRDTHNMNIGCFGASTGAAAALAAAAERPDIVKAVVSRGGRPDLAAGRLGEVKAPTLFIVGELDTHVLELNRQAMAQMDCINELAVIPGATHLFEEQGTLPRAARLAAGWFKKNLI